MEATTFARKYINTDPSIESAFEKLKTNSRFIEAGATLLCGYFGMSFKEALTVNLPLCKRQLKKQGMVYVANATNEGVQGRRWILPMHSDPISVIDRVMDMQKASNPKSRASHYTLLPVNKTLSDLCSDEAQSSVLALLNESGVTSWEGLQSKWASQNLTNISVMACEPSKSELPCFGQDVLKDSYSLVFHVLLDSATHADGDLSSVSRSDFKDLFKKWCSLAGVNVSSTALTLEVSPLPSDEKDEMLNGLSPYISSLVVDGFSDDKSLVKMQSICKKSNATLPIKVTVTGELQYINKFFYEISKLFGSYKVKSNSIALAKIGRYGFYGHRFTLHPKLKEAFASLGDLPVKDRASVFMSRLEKTKS